MEKKNKSFGQDAIKMIVPKVTPLGVKLVSSFITPGSTADQFIAKYQEYFTAAVPAITFLILQFTNAHEIVDDILAEVSAEVLRELKIRYKDGIPKPSKKGSGKSSEDKAGQGYMQMEDLMTRLDKTSFTKLNKLVSGLTKNQQKDFLSYSVPLTDLFSIPEFLGVQFAQRLSELTVAQFTLWANIAFPEKPPREKTAFEKEVQKGWAEFKVDASDGLSKGGFFTGLARKKGLI
jgi:hypothetical protein